MQGPRFFFLYGQVRSEPVISLPKPVKMQNFDSIFDPPTQIFSTVHFFLSFYEVMSKQFQNVNKP